MELFDVPRSSKDKRKDLFRFVRLHCGSGVEVRWCDLYLRIRCAVKNLARKVKAQVTAEQLGGGHSLHDQLVTALTRTQLRDPQGYFKIGYYLADERKDEDPEDFNALPEYVTVVVCRPACVLSSAAANP